MKQSMKYIATGLISLSVLGFQAVGVTAKKVFPAVALVQKTGTLTIKATGFRNEKGGAGFALYNSKAGFDKDQTFREDMARINDRIATITLRNLPVGVYGAVAFHDENNNQKLDENMLGIPTEGVGLSNNPKMSVTNIPTFDKIKFNVNEGEQTIELKIQY